MTLEDIWGALLNKNADLKCPDATVIFKAKNLKHLLQQVYDKGVAAEKTRRDFLEKMAGLKSRGKDDDFMKLFNDMMRGKF